MSDLIKAKGGKLPHYSAQAMNMARRIKAQKTARAVRRVDEALRAAAGAPAPDLARAAPDVRLGMAPPSAGRGVRRSRGGS